MLGDMLRDARESRGVSLPEAERATKIRLKYLAALEDENISSLPSPVYARGFLRNYAVYLGLDADEVLELFEESRQPTRERIKAARGGPAAKPATRERKNERISIQPLSPEPIDTRVRYGSSYIAISLLALPLIIAFYFVYSAYAGGGSRSAPIPEISPTSHSLAHATAQIATNVALNNLGPDAGAYKTPTTYVPLAPGVVPTNTPVTQPITATGSLTTTPGTDVAAQPTAPIQASNSIVADVQITTKDAWLRVLVDGVQRYSGTLPAGTTRQWTGKSTIQIRTGRGDVVRVHINGADRGFMGTPNNLIIEKKWNNSGTETVVQR
jgi:cytoskeletal protein RodZ